MEAVEDAKGLNLHVLDVRELTDFSDYMVLVSGSSSRHVKSIMRTVIDHMAKIKCKAIGIEGELHAQWILLDFTDVVVHIMLTGVRDFYDLERFWNRTLAQSDSALDEKAY